MREPRKAIHDPLHEQLLGEFFGAEHGRQQVMFFADAALDPQATQARGYPVYRLVPYIRTQIAGERDSACQVARQEDVDQFPQEWRAFKSRPEPQTTIAHLPGMDNATRRTLTELGLGSVELLANAEVVQSVNIAEPDIPNDPDAELRETAIAGPPRVLPAELARWGLVAQQFLALRAFALTGEKPRVKLTHTNTGVTSNVQH